MSITQKLVLIGYFIYLSLGNLPRIVSLAGVPSNISLTEILIYVAALLSALADSNKLKVPTVFMLAMAIVIVSFLWGCLLNGFEADAALYAARIVMMIFCATQIGSALFSYLKRTELRNVLRFLIFPYLINSVLGLIIYIAFPDSYRLWAFLAGLGINFAGDPHQGRFLSAFLDPNMYASIICGWFAIGVVFWNKDASHLVKISTLLFAACVVLSVSRIGQVLLIVFLVYALWLKTKTHGPFRVAPVQVVLWLLIPLVVGAIAYTVFGGELERLFYRFDRLSLDDASAMARFYSAAEALELLQKYPITGIGFNYIPLYRGAAGYYDSSLLSMLVTFGLIAGSALLATFFVWGSNVSRRIRRKYGTNSNIFTLTRVFMFSSIVTVCFSAIFNNLLFYQFWLIPTLSLLVLFSKLGKTAMD